MEHGLNNRFLYAAFKLKVTHRDDIGNCKRGSGTGFFVHAATGDDIFLITNRHNIDPLYKRPSKPDQLPYAFESFEIIGKNPDFSDVENINLSFLKEDVSIFNSETDDIALIKFNNLNGQQAYIASSIPYSYLATEEDFKNNLHAADFVAFPGFPEWHDKKTNRPILRYGAIASDPRFNYTYGDIVTGNAVAFEAFSYSGSSGSPVFSMQKGLQPGEGIQYDAFQPVRLIGINAGHLKTTSLSGNEGTHSGISYLFKSTTIIKLIQQAATYSATSL